MSIVNDLCIRSVVIEKSVTNKCVVVVLRSSVSRDRQEIKAQPTIFDLRATSQTLEEDVDNLLTSQHQYRKGTYTERILARTHERRY